MDRFPTTFLFLLLLSVVVSAALPPEVYWKTILPDTPMPNIIRSLLHSRGTDGSVGSVKRSHPGNYYPETASEEDIHDRHMSSLYFLEKNANPGTKLSLEFMEPNAAVAPFLPRATADAIPFSSVELPAILRRLSIRPNSPEAKAVEKTVRMCGDRAGLKGEEKYCATSLESLVDFTTSTLGTRKVQVVVTTTAAAKKGASTTYQYTVGSSGLQKLAGSKQVVCHPLTYPYAVFYCHAVQRTTAYVVPLVGGNGEEEEAVAVCHADTSQWNPKSLPLQVLKVKPGTLPVCHFLPEDNVLWAPLP